MAATRVECKLHYNPSHVVRHFYKSNPPLNIVYEGENQLWHATTTLEGNDFKTEEGCGYRSKKEVEADLIIQIYRFRNDMNSIERFRTAYISISAANRPPAQALNEFLQIRKITQEEKEETTPNGFIIKKSLTHCERLFKVQVGPYADKGYASHKAAKKMLGQLVFVDNLAWEYYSPLDTKAKFRLGDVVAMEESEVVEFKGGESAKAKYSFKNAKEKIEENERGAGCYISGFLNSKKGGSIYYGIHDGSRTVHGITMTAAEKDQLTQSLGDMISKHFYPKVNDFVRFHFHPVLEDKEDPIYEVEDKAASKETKEYIGNLEKQIAELKEKLARLENKAPKESQLYVLQIIVQEGAPDAVYWHRHTAFLKVENYLEKMPPQDIEGRIQRSVLEKSSKIAS